MNPPAPATSTLFVGIAFYGSFWRFRLLPYPKAGFGARASRQMFGGTILLNVL
jgi:hypothetical protein